MKPFYIVLLILILATTLRVYDIGYQSVWYDEMDTDKRLATLPEYLPRYLQFERGYVDNATSPAHSHAKFEGFISSPPLYFLTLYPVSRFFEWNIIQLRYYSAFFGVLLILMTYLLGKHMYGDTVGLLASLFMAIAPYQIYFSQEARFYTLFGFLSASVLYSFYRALESNQHRWWILFALCTALNIYTHPYALFLVATCCFYFLTSISKYKQSLGKYIQSQILIAVFLLPYLPILYYQLTFASLYSWLKEYTFQLIDFPGAFIVLLLGQTLIIKESPLSLLLLVLTLLAASVVLPLMLLHIHRKRNTFSWKSSQKEWYLWTFAVIPVLIPVLYSIFIEHIFQFRYVFYAAVPFFILIARAIVQLRKPVRWVALCIFLLLLSWSSLHYFTQPAKPDYQGAVRFINENVVPGDVIFVHQPLTRFVIGYYHPKAQVIALGDDTNQYMSDSALQKLHTSASDYDRIWLVLGHSRAHTEILNILTDSHEIVSEPKFLGIRLILLENYPQSI